MKNRFLLLLSALLFCVSLTGCGEDPKLTKFKNDIDSFCSQLAEIDAGINAIDPESDTARSELLDYLDQLEQSFKVLAEIDAPDEYSFVEDLSAEASEYMSTAVASYHEAYSNNAFNEYTAEYAQENYERAYKRVSVILQLLHGEEISDDSVIIETISE